MKRATRFLALLLALGLILFALAGCAPASPAAAPAPASTAAPAQTPAAAPALDTAVSVTDMMGRAVELPAPAARVVAIDAASCEIVSALGAEAALVGRGEYCDYPASVQSVPAVQSGNTTNVEQIIALQPQVVFMNTMAQASDQVDQLEKAGIRVVVSTAADIAGVYASIGLIGACLGKTAEAEALIDGMKADFDEIRNAVPAGAAEKSVYFEVSPLEYGLWTAGKDTFMDEIAGMLRLSNSFADVSGWAEVSQEQVLQRDPDYIVTISMYGGAGPDPVEEILSRGGWDQLKAVRNKDVYLVNADELSRPGPRLADGARKIFDIVYGK